MFKCPNCGCEKFYVKRVEEYIDTVVSSKTEDHEVVEFGDMESQDYVGKYMCTKCGEDYSSIKEEEGSLLDAQAKKDLLSLWNANEGDEATRSIIMSTLECAGLEEEFRAAIDSSEEAPKQELTEKDVTAERLPGLCGPGSIRGGYVQIRNLLVEVKTEDNGQGYVIDVYNNDTEKLLHTATIWNNDLITEEDEEE